MVPTDTGERGYLLNSCPKKAEGTLTTARHRAVLSSPQHNVLQPPLPPSPDPRSSPSLTPPGKPPDRLQACKLSPFLLMPVVINIRFEA